MGDTMTVIAPYVRTPTPPIVAWLDQTGRVYDETGGLIDLDDIEKNVRVWTDFDTARQLITDGNGEALCWGGDEIRWRHSDHGDKQTWNNRSSDVSVLKLPFPGRPERCTQALARWRDWLAAHGSAPIGTTGSAAWSLLRATITEPLWTASGWKGRPERLLPTTLGGRQELGPQGVSEHTGDLEHWDLPAAYANELGELPYGGRWLHTDDLKALDEKQPLAWFAQHNRPVMVRARVRVPELAYSPLPRRPRRRLAGFDALLLPNVSYPTGTTLQGLWTYQEIEQATVAGCDVRVLDAWVHLSGGSKPFAAWWAAIQEGRAMGGLAGTLAKVTGNALWGRFCMDARAGGERTIRLRGDDGRLRSVRVPMRGGLPPSHDLAETVSGRVRAKLYAAMLSCGGLISAHTDGLWTHRSAMSTARLTATDDAGAPLADWRLKALARRLQVLDPQSMRYWPVPATGRGPDVVLAGTPSRQADTEFERRWRDHLSGPVATPGLGATREEWERWRTLTT